MASLTVTKHAKGKVNENKSDKDSAMTFQLQPRPGTATEEHAPAGVDPYHGHEGSEEHRTAGAEASGSATEAGDGAGHLESLLPRDEVFLNDVQVAFSALPDVKPSWVHKYLKLVVVGEMGLGKTTFVRNLLSPYAQNSSPPVADASIAPTPAKLFAASPEKLCTEVVVRDEEARVVYHYLVQDTPGFGDKDTPVEVIRQQVIDYIAANNRKYYEAESNPARTCAMCDIPDPRVDAVLFFIAPHRLKAVEVDFMTAISRVVPMVPVLAKADCMTVSELDAFRGHVRKTLNAAGKGVMHVFTPASLDEAGAKRTCPPFAVVGSNKMDLSVGSFWPVRVYPWGRCEALSSRHSDAAAMRRLLLEVAYEDIKGCTEDRFYSFRRKSCEDSGAGSGGGPAPLKMLARLAFVGVLAAAVALGLPGALMEDMREGRVGAKVAEVMDEAASKASAAKDVSLCKAAEAKDASLRKAGEAKDASLKLAGEAKDQGLRRAGDAVEGLGKAIKPEEPKPEPPKKKKFWFLP